MDLLNCEVLMLLNFSNNYILLGYFEWWFFIIYVKTLNNLNSNLIAHKLDYDEQQRMHILYLSLV